MKCLYNQYNMQCNDGLMVGRLARHLCSIRLAEVPFITRRGPCNERTWSTSGEDHVMSNPGPLYWYLPGA